MLIFGAKLGRLEFACESHKEIIFQLQNWTTKKHYESFIGLGLFSFTVAIDRRNNSGTETERGDTHIP